MQNYGSKANMPLTLEQHFAYLAKEYPDVQNLHSLWLLLRKDLEDRLPCSRGVFAHYSLHDATHSRSVIRAIERFLGENRIMALSATDTFMILCCSYAHDYGMAITYNQIYEILGKEEFLAFLEKREKNASSLEAEDIQAIKALLAYIKDTKITASLQDQYHFIMQAIQSYLRPDHWKGVENVWEDFKGLLSGRLNERFIQGGEGIIDLCEAHGQSFDNILNMNICADGIVGDNFHPRFVAAMLRLGDLLDLDNGRFPRWFVAEVERNRKIISKLSELHYKKHEAVNHLLITPKCIQICASCKSNEDGYKIAGLMLDWIDLLEQECMNLRLHWPEITQTDFGQPPLITKKEILLNGKPYSAENRKLQMQMPQARVMKLLEGTNIYQNRYIGIRELVQNAVDASLLQLWYDITHNRYARLGVSKRGHSIPEDAATSPRSPDEEEREMSLLEYRADVLSELFGNYPIKIELVKDLEAQKVLLIVKDYGIGIDPQDARYMADIGASKENNGRILEIMEDMPRWMKPSGVFGIGLQSVFQLTDQIEFYSRRPNEPERKIIFNSYRHNCGRIEIYEVTPGKKIYYDNAPQGTNVKITIDPAQLFGGPDGANASSRGQLLHYDLEFYGGDSLHALYVELSQAILDVLRESQFDYFNIYFQTMTRKNEDAKPLKDKRQRLRFSYFAPQADSPSEDEKELDKAQKEKILQNSILPFYPNYPKDARAGVPVSFAADRVYFADKNTCRIYQLNVRQGTVKIENKTKWFQLPEPVHRPFNIQYKFSPISNADFIYPLPVRQLKKAHAGFLHWNINIMDEDPDKYLNIDRDRLRDGSIVEEELEQVQNKILNRWCKHLLGHPEQPGKEEEARDLRPEEEAEGEFLPGPPENMFESQPQLLVSFALLFYQYVPEWIFRRFIEPYRTFLEEQALTLAEEKFPVQRLWEKNAVFCTCLSDSPKWIAKAARSSEMELEFADAACIYEETLKRLPRRLIHVFGFALNSEDKLTFYFRLGRSSTEPSKICMDSAARLYDYTSVIEPDSSKPHEIDLNSLENKVFKPNKDYKHLLVSRIPKSFRLGKNPTLPLDYCIRWHILSPFDQKLTEWLSGQMKKTTPLTPAERKEHIQKYTKESTQMKKCINYVHAQYTARMTEKKEAPPKDLLETIKAEYCAFLEDCCQILIENRELIMHQFE